MVVKRMLNGIKICLDAPDRRARRIVQRRLHDLVEPTDIMLQHGEGEPFLGSEVVCERPQWNMRGRCDLTYAGRGIAALVKYAGPGRHQKFALRGCGRRCHAAF
ncbi:hypothetical protein C8J42_10821 [Sphingomonas sp. PP-CE-1A-559]|nr:hypothetical protein C8J42_10821 [Sphingomonas sp. PP-CE-1A-559]